MACKFKPNNIYHSDAGVFLQNLSNESVDLVYIDPPFYSQKEYLYQRGIKTGLHAFSDKWDSLDDYIQWLSDICKSCHTLLNTHGVFTLHLAHHSVHYMKIELDKIFGIDRFVNEIIWHYTGGGRSKQYLSRKHDTILVYSKSEKYCFDLESIRVPYKQTSGYARSGIVSKAGKLYQPNPKGTPLDDVWDIPMVNPLANERCGYPTQKPLELLARIIKAFSPPEGIVIDPMCGSGTTLIAAKMFGRKWIGADANKDAVELARNRLI